MPKIVNLYYLNSKTMIVGDGCVLLLPRNNIKCQRDKRDKECNTNSCPIPFLARATLLHISTIIRNQTVFPASVRKVTFFFSIYCCYFFPRIFFFFFAFQFNLADKDSSQRPFLSSLFHCHFLLLIGFLYLSLTYFQFFSFLFL